MIQWGRGSYNWALANSSSIHGAVRAMIHRSRKGVRPMAWLRWLLLSLYLSPFPRPLIHSHSELGESRSQALALAQHLQLYHDSFASTVEFDQLHIHWTLGPVQSKLPSSRPVESTILDSVKPSTPKLCLGDFASIGECIQRQCYAELHDLGPSKLTPIAPICSGTCQRIRFCVWTC